MNGYSDQENDRKLGPGERMFALIGIGGSAAISIPLAVFISIGIGKLAFDVGNRVLDNPVKNMITDSPSWFAELIVGWVIIMIFFGLGTALWRSLNSS